MVAITYPSHRAEWFLLGFLDQEGRFEEALREPRPEAPGAAPPPPPILLFARPRRPGQPRVPRGLPSEEQPEFRGWTWG
jgi:hypothetical protein